MKLLLVAMLSFFMVTVFGALSYKTSLLWQTALMMHQAQIRQLMLDTLLDYAIVLLKQSPHTICKQEQINLAPYNGLIMFDQKENNGLLECKLYRGKEVVGQIAYRTLKKIEGKVAHVILSAT